METHGSRHLELFEQLRAWSYIEWRKPMFETRILVEAQRINMGFAEELPLSHIASIASSIERFIAKHFSEEEYSRIQSWKGKRGAAKRWDGQGPRTDAEILDYLAAGFSVKEIAEARGKSVGSTYQAIRKAKKAAAV